MSPPLSRAWVALILLHVALLAYVLPMEVVFGDTPFGGPDYQTHYQHTSTLLDVDGAGGRSWAYDPDLLAGHPSGLIFDVDNKVHFAFSAGLHRLGVPLPIAFNLFTLVAAALAPVMVWLAARLLGQAPAARAIAFGLGIAAWNFDPTIRFCYGGGMISFAAAAALSVVVVALMHRLVTDERRADAIALLILLPLVLRTHVWSFAILVVPLTGLYLGTCSKVQVRTHLAIWAAAIAGLVINLDWLLPALAHRALIVPSAGLGQATPIYLFYDFAELLVDPRRTGFVAQRTLIRASAVLAAIGTIWGWRRAGDRRLVVGALTLAWLIGLTYFGALVPGLRATEPYRFAVPLTLWAAVLAGPWLVEAAAGLRGLSRATRAAVIGLVILLIPRVYQQIIPFIPELTPVPLISRSLPTARLGPIVADWEEVRTWLEGQPKGGRVLVQNGPLGEYLRWATRWPVLGGFYDRRMIFQDANLFYFPIDDPRYTSGLADYLARYNVTLVVMTGPYLAEIERRTDLFATAGTLSGLHRLYRVRAPAGYFAEGGGEVEATLDRIAVREATAAPGTESLVLRYHYMEELQCAPRCRVERAEAVGDSAGFIRVVGAPTLPRDFVVELP